MDSEKTDRKYAAAAAFRTTHWSVVLEAGADSDSGRTALESLCRAYWYPLYALVRRQGRQPEEAEDLTQDFLIRLIETNGFERLHPDKGRFRTFLLAALRNFLANDWDRSRRQKRGGGMQIISLDSLEPEARYQLEPATSAPDDMLFDRQWARTLASGVMARLRAEFEREGGIERFNVLKGYLASEPTDSSYLEASERLELSVPALKSAIHRLRRRYGQMLREEIANTVAREQDVEDEIRHLFAALSV